MCRALLVGGVGGVGKSTMIHAIGRVLSGSGRVVAAMDTDHLAQFGPPPRDESSIGVGTAFYDNLKCLNLAAVWANFASLGARFAVVAGGIDSLDLRDRYAEALAGCTVQVVRLTAPIETVRARLRHRAGEASNQWHRSVQQHLAGLAEQAASLDAARVEDFTVLNDRSSEEVAREILDRAGWLHHGPTSGHHD